MLSPGTRSECVPMGFPLGHAWQTSPGSSPQSRRWPWLEDPLWSESGCARPWTAGSRWSRRGHRWESLTSCGTGSCCTGCRLQGCLDNHPHQIPGRGHLWRNSLLIVYQDTSLWNRAIVKMGKKVWLFVDMFQTNISEISPPWVNINCLTYF